MEIMAVIQGLSALKMPSQVTLFGDSQYVLNAIDEWIAKWKSFGWKRSKNGKAAIRNVDLWKQLDEQLQRHQVKTHWVRGHDGHAENEKCDLLATTAAAEIAKTPAPPKPVVEAEKPPLFWDVAEAGESSDLSEE
jgi:ribonuclease HI